MFHKELPLMDENVLETMAMGGGSTHSHSRKANAYTFNDEKFPSDSAAAVIAASWGNDFDHLFQ